ncbi:acyl-CoA thioester hydrolase [Lentzea xinjiangensis]|uniref:Acyl-CoA thioester hydrolase n=1 Tax=Lentzea xinjiangensis TaxID=402600 RepID=A0A1H9T0J9_9PSEU|nr:thioesterase family protein [Lentzea xinjiangensis]SER90153.1 acyl-CoA thioester hydrolase [Lentzea xinjiangensis]
MTTPVPVAWRHQVEHVDTDASGVVHFSRYASLVESALLDLLESTEHGLAALAAREIELVVTELKIAYRAPARYRDVLTAEIGLEHVGGTQIRACGSLYRAADGGERTVLVDARVFLAAVERSNGRPTALPAPVRQAWRGLTGHD